MYSRNAGGHKCPYCMGMKATPETSLATTHPEIAAMWHPTKNGDVTPWNTKAGLGIRRWWQCKNDPSHIWELSPDKMKGPRKSGYCQQCRSLGVQNPHLIPFCICRKMVMSHHLKSLVAQVRNTGEYAWKMQSTSGSHAPTQT